VKTKFHQNSYHNFFFGGGSPTPCASPPRASIFSNYSFLVHHPVNRDDRHSLHLQLPLTSHSCLAVFSKRTIVFFITNQTPSPYLDLLSDIWKTLTIFNYGHWLPCTLVANFFSRRLLAARKQDMKISLSLQQGKTGQLDKQQTCFGQRQVRLQCARQPVSIFGN
jgi:hypothetical protein